MRTVRLREWELHTNLPLSVAERDALRECFGATVQPAPGSLDRYDVRPGNTIGATVVGDTAIGIEPKIAIKNVMFLLSYSADPDTWAIDEALVGDTDDLTSAMASLFTRLCEQALRRGLLSDYGICQGG